MSECVKCDICRADMLGDKIYYGLDRYDQHGFVGKWDICSIECLATTAVGDAHLRGEADERDRLDTRMRREGPPSRKGWWRR